ncbi:uncharacterized protein LOC136771756 isoform X2 [Amia ocellicauda]|uniref:uncharacterized protein LOC136771756 isoform X2 n=1 Tax=Amia ocellicauda TaxID=2972642 RepID=UPI003464A48A
MRGCGSHSILLLLLMAPGWESRDKISVAVDTTTTSSTIVTSTTSPSTTTTSSTIVTSTTSPNADAVYVVVPVVVALGCLALLGVLWCRKRTRERAKGNASAVYFLAQAPQTAKRGPEDQPEPFYSEVKDHPASQSRPQDQPEPFYSVVQKPVASQHRPQDQPEPFYSVLKKPTTSQHRPQDQPEPFYSVVQKPVASQHTPYPSSSDLCPLCPPDFQRPVEEESRDYDNEEREMDRERERERERWKAVCCNNVVGLG